jgi:hypothetical protein
MGESIVPSLILVVFMAAAVRETHASMPHTGSQTKNPSHPDFSASNASFEVIRASPWGRTKPYFMLWISFFSYLREGENGVSMLKRVRRDSRI